MALGLAEVAIGGSLERVVRPRPRNNKMPKETKAYACEWGCRRNVLTSRKDMASHETRCFHNPARKACVTCIHFEPATGRDEDYEAPGCDAGYEVHEKLKHDCDKWSNVEVSDQRGREKASDCKPDSMRPL